MIMTGKSSEIEITAESQPARPSNWPPEVALPTVEEYRAIVAAEKPETIYRDRGVFATYLSPRKRARRKIIINEQSPQTPERD